MKKKPSVFDYHIHWITGACIGFEIELDDFADVLTIDLAILRITLYRWKDE